MNAGLLSFLVALAAGFGLLLLFSAFQQRRLITSADGESRLEPTDLERLFAPLAQRLLRRKGHRESLETQLEWAHLGWIGPELWVLLPWVLGVCAFALSLGFLALIGLDLGAAVLMGVVMAMPSMLYPRLKLSGRLKARRRAIHEDSIRFVAQFSRTYSAFGRGTVSDTLQAIARHVRNDRRWAMDQDKLTAEMRARLRRRRGEGPYDSALWDGLLDLVNGLGVRDLASPSATLERPDLLLEFALWCAEPDIDNFVELLRQGELSSNPIESGHLDRVVATRQAVRVEENRQANQRAAFSALLFGAAFGLPGLLACVALPILGIIFGPDSGFMPL